MEKITHTKEVIVCQTKNEAKIVKIIMESPLACWGGIPTETKICPDLIVPFNIGTGGIVLKNEMHYPRKKNYTDDITVEQTRFITFDIFMHYWLEDKAE